MADESFDERMRKQETWSAAWAARHDALWDEQLAINKDTRVSMDKLADRVMAGERKFIYAAGIVAGIMGFAGSASSKLLEFLFR